MATMTTTTIAKHERLPDWFASFCEPIESTRYPGLIRPWTDPADGYTYATDGRAIVRVRSDLIADAARPAPPETPRDVPRHPGRDIYGMRPGDEWEDAPLELPPGVGPWKVTCPECKGEPTAPHRVACEECEGTGADMYDPGDLCPACDGKKYHLVDECYGCDNAGIRAVWEAVEIPGRGDGLTLSVANVRRVLDAGGLIFARKGPDAPKSALKFTVGEDFEGRLMPVRNSTTTTEA
jgi:hypothetical protein